MKFYEIFVDMKEGKGTCIMYMLVRKYDYDMIEKEHVPIFHYRC